ncbi:MAG: hypothetical protein IT477_10225 [Rhodanobacteraceae bacterium]|nr:hypothetical protein [Rhodanobacteraceae bacterium]
MMPNPSPLSYAKRFFPLVALALAALAPGACAPSEPEWREPQGFSAAEQRPMALGAMAFQRQSNRRIVTWPLEGEDRRDPESRFRLHIALEPDYADGLTVAVASHPEATVRLVPLGAQRVPGRVRPDGALVAFEGAYPGVTAVMGARQTRADEWLRVERPADLPSLRYRMTLGAGVGEVQADEGRIWVYGADGAGLFVVLPPTADDARGRHVEGTWALEPDGSGYVARAILPLDGLTYPLVIDPTFEIPTWFRNQASGDSVNGRGAPAANYDPSTDCAVMFGGLGASLTVLSDVSARCSNRLWKANVPQSATKPSGRYYSAIGYFGGSTQAMFLFGGYTAGGLVNDLWKGKVTCTTPGSAATCSVAWTQITTNPTGRPSARYLHGMGWTGSELLIFGGVDGAGNGLRDTWAYDADTDTWTQKCSTCFGGSFGLYGLAAASVIRNGQREIYAFGGYNYASFDNRVFRWNAASSTWDDVSGSDEQIPVNEDGVLGNNATPLAPAPRYLGWAAGTGAGNLLIGSGVNGANADVYLTDTWIWYDRSADNLGYRWLRAPVPPAGQIDDAPGKRESAAAIFDEANDEVALISGVVISSTGTETFTTRQRVYRGVPRQVTLTQECLGPDPDMGTCTNARLRVVFNGIASSGDCAQQRATFVTRDALAFSGAGGWVILTGGGNVTPSWSGTECAAQLDAPWDSSRYSDYGVRVRDNRFHVGGSGCTNAGEDVALGAAAKPACLPAASNARAGSAACGQIADPESGTIACELF